MTLAWQASALASSRGREFRHPRITRSVEAFRPLRRGCRVHPHDFPDITIRVFDAAAEHEAVVLRRVWVGCAAGGAGLSKGLVHRFTTVDAQGQQHVALASRIAYRSLGELPVVFVRQEHHANGLGKHH